ncbi:hypothetical protein NDI43_09425 [Microcoleus vaginatus GB2-A3]
MIFPHLNFDLPFFGADLVTLPGGLLITLDMQPLFGGDAHYQAKCTGHQTYFSSSSTAPSLGWPLSRGSEAVFVVAVSVHSPQGNGSCGNSRFCSVQRLCGG